jgi:FkbM family methyltransferase
MIMFCRNEYGMLKGEGVVVDIGSNIGTFSLKAAECGHKLIVAVEPSAEAFTVLVKNIQDNGLVARVLPLRAAIGSGPSRVVAISKYSSPYNISRHLNVANAEYDLVPTISLEELFNKYELKTIHTLKMDCEGAEYEALFGASQETLNRIERIRMEMHHVEGSSLENLIAYLVDHGFRVVLRRDLIVWLDRR